MTDANPVIEAIRQAFPEAVLDVQFFRDEATLVLSPLHLVRVARFLHDEPTLAFNLLKDITAVDYMPQGQSPRFAVVYHIYSFPYGYTLRLVVRVGEGEAVPSVVPIWPGANWYEREVYDMFGIRFAGHPDLRRILMPEDTTGYPLRKDFPLGDTPVDHGVEPRH